MSVLDKLLDAVKLNDDYDEDEYDEFKKIVPESARPFYGH